MDGLKRRWAQYWPEADVEAMAADVLARAEEALEAWELSRPERLPGGNIALVLASEDAVVKVNPRGHPDDEQLAAEAVAISFWRSSGVVPGLHGRRDGGLTLLMDRLLPGTPLDASGVAWEERLELLGELAGRLHGAGAAPDSIPPLGGTYARDWRRLVGDSPLLAAREDDVLLHADLHGGNALRHESGWRVIDPHAVRGDRHADVWALIDPLAPAAPDRSTAWAWVERYAAAAGLDPERAGAWVRLRARAEALRGADGDPSWQARLAATAELLRT